MAITDIATRTYDHGWRLDPIVRSLLDTDFYKLLMLQMIRQLHPATQVTFSLINRSRTVRLADSIDEEELRAQLDHARQVRFTRKELIWHPPDHRFLIDARPRSRFQKKGRLRRTDLKF